MKSCCTCKTLQSFDNFHRSSRYPDGYYPRCKFCITQANKKYYASHKEMEKARQATGAYRTQNRIQYLQKKKEQAKRYRTRHPEKLAKAGVLYRSAHAPAIRKRIKAWVKRDRQIHPEKNSIHCAVRRARMKNASVIEPINLQVLAERDHWICHICKKKVTKRTWSHDHLIPLALGGDHSYLNVALAHLRCNIRRGTGRIPAQLRLLS